MFVNGVLIKIKVNKPRVSHVSVVNTKIKWDNLRANHVQVVHTVLLVHQVVHLMHLVVLQVPMPMALRPVILVKLGNTTINQIKHLCQVVKIVARVRMFVSTLDI